MITPLTKEQALVVSGFTGILCCNFADFHEDVERRLGRPVWTHEFASEKVNKEVKKAYEADFKIMAGAG